MVDAGPQGREAGSPWAVPVCLEYRGKRHAAGAQTLPVNQKVATDRPDRISVSTDATPRKR